MTRRRARGFSQGELTAAGMTAPLASGWGANVDVRRRSVIAANVQALRKWASSPSQEPKKEAMAKKIVEEVEEEVEKVEEEVKKESVKVKRKAAKAEKAVAKVEKEVVEKAEEVGKGAKSRAKKRAPKKKKVE
jgi:Ribosomal protein L13e